MMIYSTKILSEILFLFIINSTGELLDLIDNSTFVTLLTNDTSLNETNSNESTSLPTSATLRTKDSMISLVDQINSYRHTHILARIAQCDSNIRLNDICETYSIDNETNALIRQSDIDFLTFEDLFNRLVNQSGLSLRNLSDNDILFTSNVIQKQGRSFCSLEQCQSRLTLFSDSCPILANTNISIPTLKLLPMLCTLYNEQLSWNSTGCMDEIVYLLHTFYAFWPQFEKCYNDHFTGFDCCTTECQTLNNMLTELKQQCNDAILFLSEVPILSWYQSIHFQEMCDEKPISKRPTFIYSIEKYFSFHRIWHRFYQKSVYIPLLVILVISLVFTFFVCFFIKSKYCLKRNNRRFNNDYEYTRLHNTSFELGSHSEILNYDSTANGSIDEETQLDSNDRLPSPEYQRLIFVNS